MQVVGPVGTPVLLMSDVGEPPRFEDTEVNDINPTLDDEAANYITDSGQLSRGIYKPTKGSTPFCNIFQTPQCIDLR